MLHLHQLNLRTSAAEFNTTFVVLAFVDAVVCVVNVLFDFL